MKRLTLYLLLILLSISELAYANSYYFEINANDSVAEARTGVIVDPEHGPVSQSFSLGGLYNDDDYLLASIDWTWGNKLTGEGFKFDMGFRGLWGTIERVSEEENETNPKDRNLWAVGFLIQSAFDIPESPINYIVPFGIEISGELCLAPSALNFSDTDNYMEIKGEIAFNILQDKMGAIYIGFRRLGIDVTDENIDTELTEDAAYIGFKIRF